MSMPYLRCDACLMLFNGENFIDHHHEEIASFTIEFALDQSGTENKEVDSMGMQEWAQERAKKGAEERKARSAEKGYEEFLKLPNGTSTLEFVEGEEPRELTGAYGPQTVFKVRYQPKGGNLKVYDWAVSNRSYSLLQAVVGLLAQGVTQINVTRIGSGMDTRYEVTEA